MANTKFSKFFQYTRHHCPSFRVRTSESELRRVLADYAKVAKLSKNDFFNFVMANGHVRFCF